MPRTKAGEQTGFLNDAHAIDGMKIMFFVGTFETALVYLAGSTGNIGLDMMRILLYMLGLPTSGTAGAKALVDMYEKAKEATEDVPSPTGGVADAGDTSIPEVLTTAGGVGPAVVYRVVEPKAREKDLPLNPAAMKDKKSRKKFIRRIREALGWG